MESTSMSTAVFHEVFLRDVFQVFRCSACLHAPLLPPVYSCRQGHSVCSDCRDIVRNECVERYEALTTRNLSLEDILLAALYDRPKDLIVLGENGKKEEESGMRRRIAAMLDHLSCVVAKDCYGQMLAGGRTAKCPFPCDVRVTAPGLYRHFGFQHPEVFVGMLCKNHPCSIFIPYDHFVELDERNPTRCVYIFVVDIGDEDQREEDKMTALYSMNAAELLNITHSMRYMLRRHKYLAMLSVSRTTGDACAAWVTALYDFSPVKYTLRYSCESSCVSYQGRPKSLHIPLDSWSDCLVLPIALMRRNFHAEGLELTLAFHLDLPFPQGQPLEKESEPDRAPLCCDS